MGLCQPNTRGLRRRDFLGALVALQLAPGWPLAGETGRETRVIVIFVSGSEAHQEAVSGLRTGLAGLAPGPVFIDLKSPGAEGEILAALAAGPQRVLITVGTEALTAVNSRVPGAATVSTMILRSDRTRGSQAPATVYLDVALASLLGKLEILLPGSSRCGIIQNSSRDEPDPSLPGRVKQQGFTLTSAACSRPEDLVKSFLSLKGKADFVVVLPDSSLYNNTTVRPLILASLESRLPIVAFSSSFVRAGAAMGVYPDFRDIGLQTADVALKLIAGKTGAADEAPRKLQVAVNQRVLRLLGLECQGIPGLVTFR